MRSLFNGFARKKTACPEYRKKIQLAEDEHFRSILNGVDPMVPIDPIPPSSHPDDLETGGSSTQGGAYQSISSSNGGGESTCQVFARFLPPTGVVIGAMITVAGFLVGNRANAIIGGGIAGTSLAFICVRMIANRCQNRVDTTELDPRDERVEMSR